MISGLLDFATPCCIFLFLFCFVAAASGMNSLNDTESQILRLVEEGRVLLAEPSDAVPSSDAEEEAAQQVKRSCRAEAHNSSKYVVRRRVVLGFMLRHCTRLSEAMNNKSRPDTSHLQIYTYSHIGCAWILIPVLSEIVRCPLLAVVTQLFVQQFAHFCLNLHSVRQTHTPEARIQGR